MFLSFFFRVQRECEGRFEGMGNANGGTGSASRRRFSSFAHGGSGGGQGSAEVEGVISAVRGGADGQGTATWKNTGLYESCPWDDRTVKRLVMDKKIAPRCRGVEAVSEEAHVECPICFMGHTHINRSVCCNKPICTECVLQILRPRCKVS